jgi:hypothetical protein
METILMAFCHFALRLLSGLQLGTLRYAKKQNAPQYRLKGMRSSAPAGAMNDVD